MNTFNATLRFVTRWTLLFVCVGLALPSTQSAPSVRVKELIEIEGVRSNPLIGYGLVVGLEGTGDGTQAAFTAQSLANLLRRSGVQIPPNLIRVKNVAAVMVTADLPPFARPTQRIDVIVSSIGDAKSLRGGTLLMTPLAAPDGTTYAVAQGPLSLGGAFGASAGGNSVVKNHLTVASIPAGGVVERALPFTLQQQTVFRLLLNQPDFATAERIVTAINKSLPHVDAHALAINSSTIELHTSEAVGKDPVTLLAAVEALEVRPDIPAKIVVNERTGTIVMGEQVRISAVALAHGSLTIEVTQQFQASQPEPLSDGETVVFPDNEIYVSEGPNRILGINDSLTVEQLVRALNSLGVSARDMVAILQAMHSAGALHAELEVM